MEYKTLPQNNIDNLSKSIANMIRTKREELGITQTQLAEKIGTQQPSIAKLESGESLPSLSFLNKIADCLDIQLIVEARPVLSKI